MSQITSFPVLYPWTKLCSYHMLFSFKLIILEWKVTYRPYCSMWQDPIFVYVFIFIGELCVFICFCVAVQHPFVSTGMTPLSSSGQAGLVVINNLMATHFLLNRFLQVATDQQWLRAPTLEPKCPGFNRLAAHLLAVQLKARYLMSLPRFPHLGIITIPPLQVFFLNFITVYIQH